MNKYNVMVLVLGLAFVFWLYFSKEIKEYFSGAFNKY